MISNAKRIERPGIGTVELKQFTNIQHQHEIVSSLFYPNCHIAFFRDNYVYMINEYIMSPMVKHNVCQRTPSDTFLFFFF